MSRPAKSDTVNALIIDPHSRMIYKAEIENSLKGFYAAAKCECIDAVYINDSDVIYVDDEGLLGDLSKQAFFAYEGVDVPLAGIGVVVGTDAEGNSTDPGISLIELSRRVRFLGTPNLEESSDDQEAWGFV